MKLSQYLLPVLREDPNEASITSHRLMLRTGMIRQLSSGIYNWLPLGKKVLRNIEDIVREEMDRAGALELLMPTMQPAELWAESGRGDYGKETLVAEDRHGRKLIYGPTNEEVITDIFRSNVRSYKELPKNLYHIQWKFRDEIRPRFGVMRGREFLMKDAYSFDIDEASAKKSYDLMYRTYLGIFKRLGLRAIPFNADTGIIGGSMSHEFHVIADTGESEVFYDSAFDKLLDEEKPDIKAMQKLYAMADDRHDPENYTFSPTACGGGRGGCSSILKTARGIEVGHIFYLDDKYSKAMGASVLDSNGKSVPVKMGCYGIGISRLVGAVIEANHDDRGIIWPDSITPFKVGIINIKTGNEQCDELSNKFYNTLKNKNINVLYDDRKESAGSKFATMDLIGIPWQIAIGPRGIKSNTVELKNRKTDEKQDISIETALDGCCEIEAVARNNMIFR